MVSRKDAESSVDSEKNKPRSYAESKNNQRDDDGIKKKAARLPGPHTEKKRH